MLIVMKLLILLSVIYIGYLIAFRVNVLLVQRLVTLLMGLLISVFIIFPPITTRIANTFGIGRGVDFIFYLAHLLVVYVLVRQYLNYQELNRSLTGITRLIAIMNAKKY